MEAQPVAVNLADTPELVTPGDLGDELASFVRAMRANNVSSNTILAFGGAVRPFDRWVTDHDHPTDVGRIERRNVEERIGEVLERKTCHGPQPVPWPAAASTGMRRRTTR